MRARGRGRRGEWRALRVLAAASLAAASAALAAGDRWTRLGDGAAWAAPCRIGDETRPATACDGSGARRLAVALPVHGEGTRVELAIALSPVGEAGAAPGATRVRASVAGTDGTPIATIWERTLDPARAADAGWQSMVAPLPPLPAAPHTLVLESSPGADAVGAPVVWARPVLRKGGEAPAPVPGVIVVSLDGLRADRVLDAGRPRPPAPIVGRIARAGFVFTRAFAPTPDPGASHVAMLAGRHPSCERSENGETMLGGALAAAGWAAAVIGDDEALASLPGFDRAFTLRPDAFADAARLTDRWLGEIGTAPFLLVVQTGQVGRPADLPPAARARIQIDPAASRIARERAHYDAAVGWTDEGLGGVLGALTRRGLVGRAILVVTSAVGFELGERGAFGIGRTVHAESLHVPLVVHHPAAGRPRQIPFPVELRDLPRTILDLAGVSADPAMPGESLLPAMRGETPVPRDVIGEQHRAARRVTALRTARFSWVLRGEQLALYDLAADPNEQRDVAGDLPAVAAEGRERIRAFRAICPGGP
jgi:hypothetical protein